MTAFDCVSFNRRTNSAVVRAYGYNTDDETPAAVWSYDYLAHAASVVGTLAHTGIDMAGDQVGQPRLPQNTTKMGDHNTLHPKEHISKTRKSKQTCQANEPQEARNPEAHTPNPEPNSPLTTCKPRHLIHLIHIRATRGNTLHPNASSALPPVFCYPRWLCSIKALPVHPRPVLSALWSLACTERLSVLVALLDILTPHAMVC